MQVTTRNLETTFTHLAQPPKEAPQRRQIVLCAQGDEQFRLAKILEQLDYVVVIDNDGRAASSLDTAPIAAVVSDTVPNALGACQRSSMACPVVLVSDQPGFPFRLASAKAQVSALIRRPVNPTEMSEWLTDLSTSRSNEGLSVLIVDDDWLTAEVWAEVLRSAGIRVRAVDDPTLALDAIEEETPDLILMDMQMPNVSGLELTRVIKQSRQFSSLPIIFLSAERDEARQMEARRIGGDDFIIKPVSPERLISTVRLRVDRSKQLRTLIERDRLTGLYDATSFRERLTQELERCCRTGGEVTLAMIDVDFFKSVNDTYGHLMGDHVLRTLANSLVSNLRRIDIVGRSGGEEFGVVLLDSGPEAAAKVIDRIRADFARLSFDAGDKRFNVTFSAGIQSSRAFGNRVSNLIASADGALYDCKRNGRNMVRLSTTTLATGAPSAHPLADSRSILCNS